MTEEEADKVNQLVEQLQKEMCDIYANYSRDGKLTDDQVRNLRLTYEYYVNMSEVA